MPLAVYIDVMTSFFNYRLTDFFCKSKSKSTFGTTVWACVGNVAEIVSQIATEKMSSENANL